ncbi:MAG TPA: ferric reductase-like transmembrane domain-containing protein [Nakamurella sp.]
MINAQLLWFVSRSSGVVALALLTASLTLGIATAGRAGGATLPRAAVLRLHRNLALLTVVFVVAHIVTAIADGYVDLDALDAVLPFGSGFDPLWIGLGALATDLMIAMVATSLLRDRMSRTMWRVIHLTAYGMWPIALLHGWGTSGGDTHQGWMLAVDVGCVLVVLFALGWRLVRPPHPDSVARAAGARVAGRPAGGGAAAVNPRPWQDGRPAVRSGNGDHR